MPFGRTPPAALGAVTAPNAVTLAPASSVTTGLTSWGLYQPIPLPSLNAVIFTHGTEAMRYAMEGGSYRIGLLAPDAGLTADSTAVKSSSTLTFTGQPSDGDRIQLGVNVPLFKDVYFKSTLDTTSGVAQVKIGASLAVTITNLQSLIEGTGTNGTQYYDGYQVHVGTGTYDADFWFTAHGIEAPSATVTSTAIQFQSAAAGTAGNALVAFEVTDSGNKFSFNNTPTMSGGAVGTGTVPGAGDFQYTHQTYRSVDGALSSAAQPYVALAQDGNSNVSVAAMPAFVARDATDYNRVLRTTAGGNLLYKAKDTTGTSVTDDVSDDTLADEFLRFKYDKTKYRPRASGYPTVGRCGAIWRGRLWTGGASKAADYTQGTISSSSGKTVTMAAGCRVQEDMIGRTLIPAAGTIRYLILDAVPSTRVLTLNRTYEGATGNYTIRDDRNPFALDYSEPQLVNQFPPANNIEGITSNDPAGITGIIAAWDTLVVFTKTGVWRVSGNTGAFRLQNIGEGMGCFGPNAVQNAGGVLYWLGSDGVWEWGGQGDPRCLSKPATDEPDGIQGTIDRINVEEGDGVVSNYNPSSHCVRWWVPLDGETMNDYCLRYDLQVRSFALNTASNVSAAVTMPGTDGTGFVTTVGDTTGQVWQLDAGYSDGAYGFEPVQTVGTWTASTRTIGVSGTPFPTTGDGLAGVPLLMVPVSGPPYELAKIASNTSSSLVLSAPPSAAPAVGDYLIVGGIPLDIETPHFDYEQPELLKWLEAVTLSHAVSDTPTEVWCGGCADNDVPSTFVHGGVSDSALVNESDGQKHFWQRTPRGRTLAVRFLSYGRGAAVSLRGFVLSIRSPRNFEVEG